MFAALRNALRALIDHELGVIGDELERVEQLAVAAAADVETLRLRYNALQARVGMRMARSTRHRPGGEEDAAEALNKAAGHQAGTRATPQNGEEWWPDVENNTRQ